MNQRFVEAFYWVATLKSMTRAAEKLRIRLPTCIHGPSTTFSTSARLQSLRTCPGCASPSRA